MRSFQKKLTNSFYALLSLPATAMGFALSVQIAALSWILSTRYGLDIHDVGLVWAAGPLAGIIGQVLVGVISDKVWFWNGRRRPFILIGGVLAAMMLLALPNIGVIHDAMGFGGILGIAILVTLTLDLAINISFNPTRSIIADVTPEGRARTKGYTWMQTVSGTFGIMAYLIGALLNNYVLIYFGVGLVLLFSLIPPFFIKEPKIIGTYGDDHSASEPATEQSKASDKGSFIEILTTIRPLWGFLLYAIYGLVVRIGGLPSIPGHIFEICCFVLTIFLIAEALLKSENGKTREEAGLIGFRKVLAAHSFTWIGVQTMFIYMFAFIRYRLPEFQGFEIDLSQLNLLDIQATELTTEQIGIVDRIKSYTSQIINWSFFSLNLVAAIIPVLILEPLASKFGRVKTHAFSLGIMAVGYFLIIQLGYSALMLYVLMAIVGIGWAATISLPFAIMSQKVPQQRMGLYMGLFNLSVVLPQLVASLGVGELVSAIESKTVIFIIASTTIAFSAIAWSFVKEPVDRS
ncbi:MAG TPA: MFS transporter [Bacteroidales bacterium]|nr:MFS transporter [Bacteroidales bacterium]